ncbi:MAG: sigma 54-interacting transcriptional regulator [Syntrophales bacterium]|nr:sigma 54-interacting transcriptional regulator [Syntrophales bacterium]
MINIPDILIQVLNNVSDAAAIVNQDGHILYENQSFARRFHAGDDRRKRRLKLRDMNLKLNLREGMSESQEFKLSDKEGAATMSVVFVDNPGNEEARYLIMSKKVGGIEADHPSQDAKTVIPPNLAREQTETLCPEFGDLIGDDSSFKRALLIAQKAAKSDLPVLILGESGTGKEILARAIHRTSRRSTKPLVDVNCAAIPDTLIESELFGYERGAFTGARTEGRSGYFDAAHEGTILMDEIGDASLQSQSKLLRVLEDGCFKRVGGNRNVKVDVRLISSTNKDLRKHIEEKAFREDLFYRLNTFTIQLPPLRERVKDIPLLIDFFLVSSFNRDHRHFKFLPSSMEILQAYHWPGNVRELKGVVSYAVNMSSGSIISPEALPNFLLSSVPLIPEIDTTRAAASTAGGGTNLAGVLQDVERDLIREALENSANKSEAIKRLGISRRTFYIKIKQYGFC